MVYKDKYNFFGDKKIKSATEITIDGSSGNVYLGKVPTLYPEMSESFITLMEWADKLRKLKVKIKSKYKLDKLKTICSTGSPLSEDSIHYIKSLIHI